MTNKHVLRLAEELLDRFFRDAEGRPDNPIDLGFVLNDMKLDFAKADPALEYLLSRGLITAYTSDVVRLTSRGCAAIAEEQDIKALPKFQPEWGGAKNPPRGAEAPRPSAPPVSSTPKKSEYPRPYRPTLTYTNPEGHAVVVELGWSVVVGRSDEATLKIPDARASKRHAEIKYAGDRYTVRDLGSANGTMVNGAYIETRALRHDDVILIGRTELVYRCPEVIMEPAGERPDDAAATVAHVPSTVPPSVRAGKTAARELPATERPHETRDASAKPAAAVIPRVPVSERPRPSAPPADARAAARAVMDATKRVTDNPFSAFDDDRQPSSATPSRQHGPMDDWPTIGISPAHSPSPPAVEVKRGVGRGPHGAADTGGASESSGLEPTMIRPPSRLEIPRGVSGLVQIEEPIEFRSIPEQSVDSSDSLPTRDVKMVSQGPPQSRQEGWGDRADTNIGEPPQHKAPPVPKAGRLLWQGSAVAADSAGKEKDGSFDEPTPVDQQAESRLREATALLPEAPQSLPASSLAPHAVALRGIVGYATLMETLQMLKDELGAKKGARTRVIEALDVISGDADLRNIFAAQDANRKA